MEKMLRIRNRSSLREDDLHSTNMLTWRIMKNHQTRKSLQENIQIEQVPQKNYSNPDALSKHPLKRLPACNASSPLSDPNIITSLLAFAFPPSPLKETWHWFQFPTAAIQIHVKVFDPDLPIGHKPLQEIISPVHGSLTATVSSTPLSGFVH